MEPADPAKLYLDYGGWIVLAAFAMISVLLAAVSGGRLSRQWWIGSGVSGLVVVGLALVLVFALGAMDAGGGGFDGANWAAIGVAGVIGFVAGTDVQLVVAAFGRGAHAATVVAGAILGPLLVVGGYLLLIRTMDWVRLG